MAEDATFQVNYIEGVNKFNSARSKAFWEEMFGFVRGKTVELMSFDDVRARLNLREEHYKGIQDVPLDKIAGSVGRHKDFTSAFLPKSSKMKDRWSRVYAKANGLEGLPPIELYRVGDVYFVRDGNHRVSVAKQLDAKSIEAHVTELPTSVPIRPGMTGKDLDAVEAYSDFLDETGLLKTRPHHISIELSDPSGYHELMGHIYLHQRMKEQMTGKLMTADEAAADWYDAVYRPAVTLIRKYDVLSHTDKERTEADVYLWLFDHMREARRHYGDDSEVHTFSEALVDYLRENKADVPNELELEEDDSVILSKTQALKAVKANRTPENGNQG